MHIDFPRGRFKLIFTSREYIPSETPLDPRASKWGRINIALGVALVIAVCLCIYWGVSAARWRRAASPGADAWQPSLEEFWSPFLNSSTPTPVCVGAPMFLMLRPGSLILRNPGINTWEEAVNSGLVDKVKRAFPGRSPQEWYVFTGLGEADGVFRLG